MVDAIRTGRNECLLVFEKLDVDLQTHLAICGTMQVTVCRNLCASLWRALAQLETVRVLHGDVKPANILVAVQNGQAQHVKLCDFGLARFINLNESSTSSESAKRKLVTLNYRSVECLLGSDEVDSRLDRWAGACVCHQIGAHSKHPRFSGANEESVVCSIFDQLGLPTADEEAAVYNKLPLWSVVAAKWYVNAKLAHRIQRKNTETSLDEETCLKVAADPGFLCRCFHFTPRSRPSARLAAFMLDSSVVSAASICSYRGTLCPSNRDPLIFDPQTDTPGPLLITIDGLQQHHGERGDTVILYGRLPLEMATFLGDDPFLSKSAAQLEELGLQSWTLPKTCPSDSHVSSRVLTSSLQRQCRGDRGKKIQLAGHVCKQTGAGDSLNALRTDQRLQLIRFSAFRLAWFKKHMPKWKLLQRNLQSIGARQAKKNKKNTSKNIADLLSMDVEKTMLAAATAHMFSTKVASASEPHSFSNCELADAAFEEETDHVDGSAGLLACGITPKGGGNR